MNKGSKTGTYAWRDGRLVKISDKTPGLGFVTEASLPRLKGRIHRPFKTDNISGKEEEYTSRRQLYSAMKSNRVSYAEKGSAPDRPPRDPKKIEKHVAETMEKVCQKRSFHWEA